MQQVEEIKGRAFNEDRVVPRHIPQDSLYGLHHSLAQQLGGGLVTERQDGAELEDVD